MSTITITGRLTSDPEMRFTPNGTVVVNLRIAENHSRRRPDGGYEQTGTTFYNVTRWATKTSSAEVEAIAGALHRGDLVLINGRLAAREYETREGEKRTAWEVNATDVAVPLRGQTVTVTRNPRGTGDTEPADTYDEPPF
jgi:single-strand DNA-binding protein